MKIFISELVEYRSTSRIFRLIVKFWKLKTNLIFMLSLLFVLHCTFGNVGNSLDEKKLLISRLALFQSNLKTNASLQLVFFDDQGDNRLENFQISSSGGIYNISLEKDSIIQLEKIDLATQTNANLSENNETIKHTETTVSSPNSNSTLKILTTANNYTNKEFYISNSSDETGNLHSSSLFSLNDISQGTLNSITLHINQIVLKGTSVGSANTKTFLITLAKSDFLIRNFCNKNFQAGNNLGIRLQFKFVNLFKDQTRVKIMKAIHDLSSPNILINITNNSDIYTEIINNLNLSDTIKEYRCNK
jgi:hypothetical protein